MISIVSPFGEGKVLRACLGGRKYKRCCLGRAAFRVSFPCMLCEVSSASVRTYWICERVHDTSYSCLFLDLDRGFFWRTHFSLWVHSMCQHLKNELLLLVTFWAARFTWSHLFIPMHELFIFVPVLALVKNGQSTVPKSHSRRPYVNNLFHFKTFFFNNFSLWLRL